MRGGSLMIANPDAETSIVNVDGVMNDNFQRWVTDVTNEGLIIGTGSPEGSIDANVGREYLDDTGLSGAIKFIKQKADILGDKTKGWVAV